MTKKKKKRGQPNTNDSVVVIDCPVGAPGPLMRVAGMSVAARLAKESLRDGHQVAIRSTAEQFEAINVSEVAHLNLGEALPSNSRVVSASELLGVELADDASRRKAEWAVLQTCRRPYDGLADRYWLRAERRHCDLYITDFNEPLALRFYLLVNRMPAIDKMVCKSSGVDPKLFATFEGARVQVVMASRMGDVGITPDLTDDAGYRDRVMLDELTDFSDGRSF